MIIGNFLFLTQLNSNQFLFFSFWIIHPGSPSPELSWYLNGRQLSSSSVGWSHVYSVSSAALIDSHSRNNDLSTFSYQHAVTGSDEGHSQPNGVKSLPSRLDQETTTPEDDEHLQWSRLLHESELRLQPTRIDSSNGLVQSELRIGRLIRQMLLARLECRTHLRLDGRRIRSDYQTNSITLDMNCE